MISKTFFKEIQTISTEHQNLIVGYSSAKADSQWQDNDHIKRDFLKIAKMLAQLWVHFHLFPNSPILDKEGYQHHLSN